MRKEKKDVFTARTVEEAKQLASEAFGVPADQIVFRIQIEPKKGILGLGQRNAVVEAIYEYEEEETIKSSDSPKTASEEPKKNAAEPEKEEKLAQKQKEAISSVDQILIPQDDSPTRGIESETIETILTEEEMSPNVLRTRQYIADIYRCIGVNAAITAMRTENGIRMEIRSQNKSGTIIGRRGETLDSIQYLASILLNKESESYCRLLLDSNGYREKRRRTLEQLAEKIAKNVQRSGRSTTLEPMNPYERRIIHSRISKIDGVTSRSVGEDPYRKVVISSLHEKKGGYRGRGGKQRTHREPEEMTRQNLDSMKTSFERDYKKPKPEDDLHAGLYGKIEL